uniref:(northern house mosquito) hypothetical protein n=1 Tax=Culex pipiens TaxID=7175 RepID=A0A8D8BKN9_CULPI
MAVGPGRLRLLGTNQLRLFPLLALEERRSGWLLALLLLLLVLQRVVVIWLLAPHPARPAPLNLRRRGGGHRRGLTQLGRRRFRLALRPLWPTHGVRSVRRVGRLAVPKREAAAGALFRRDRNGGLATRTVLRDHSGFDHTLPTGRVFSGIGKRTASQLDETLTLEVFCYGVYKQLLFWFQSCQKNQRDSSGKVCM